MGKWFSGLSDAEWSLSSSFDSYRAAGGDRSPQYGGSQRVARRLRPLGHGALVRELCLGLARGDVEQLVEGEQLVQLVLEWARTADGDVLQFSLRDVIIHTEVTRERL